MVGKGNFTGVGRTAERRSPRRVAAATMCSKTISGRIIEYSEITYSVYLRIVLGSLRLPVSIYHARIGYRTLFIAKPLGGIYNSQAERHGKIHTRRTRLNEQGKSKLARS